MEEVGNTEGDAALSTDIHGVYWKSAIGIETREGNPVVKEWFGSLSTETQSAALLVKDKEFLSILSSLFVSSSSTNGASNGACPTKIDGGSTVDVGFSQFLDVKVSESEIQGVLKDKLGRAIMTVQGDTVSEDSSQHKSDADDDAKKAHFHRKVEVDGEGTRIREMEGDDEYRIRDSSNAILDGSENAIFDTSKDTFSSTMNVKDDGRLKDFATSMKLIFPSLVRATAEKVDGSEVWEATPFIYFEASESAGCVVDRLRGDFTEAFEHGEVDIVALWYDLLGSRMREQGESLTLRVVVETRVQANLLQLYQQATMSSSKEPETGSGDTHPAKNREHYSTPPEDIASDGSEAKSVYSTPPANLTTKDGDGRKSKESLETINLAIDHLHNEAARQAKIDEKTKQGAHVGIFCQSELASMLQRLGNMCESTRKLAKEKDFEAAQEAVGCAGMTSLNASLPFVPVGLFMETLTDGDDISKQLESWDRMVETFVSSTLMRGKPQPTNQANETAGAEKGKRESESRDKAERKAVPESNETQPVPPTSTKKSKKKKKKRRRKASNSEPAQPKASEPENTKRTPETDGWTEEQHHPSNPTVQVEKAVEEKTELEGLPDDDDDATVSTIAGVDSRSTVSEKSGARSTTSEPKEPKRASDQSEVRIFRVEGVGTRCVVVPGTEEPKKDAQSGKGKPGELSAAMNEDDDDEWETVEVKSRSNRNRKMNELKQASMPSSNRTNAGGSQRKVKSSRAAGRRRNANRKIVRDILDSVLDAVDAEVKRRRKAESLRRQNAARKMQPTATTPVARSMNSKATRPATLRDVVVGSQPSRAVSPVAAPLSRSSVADRPKKPQPFDGRKNQSLPSIADQNTASTVPETLSGTSANTQSSLNTDDVVSETRTNRTPAEEVTVGQTGSVDGEGDVAPARSKSAEGQKDNSPAPPLPTLLGPGNTNSASSSVASSLEAPHATNRRHHHSSSAPENDVGYHLLDVCDRLTRDMNVFMTRRDLALKTRRRERGALLSALQETAAKLWGGHCRVELYGSCATKLDLPSSDVDALICGLDDGRDLRARSDSDLSLSSANMSPNPYARQAPLSKNGERVLMLKAELDKLPWAVQVKAIPTATVPVAKILADPSQLPGAMGGMNAGGEWMMHQQHVATPAGPNVLNSADQRFYPNQNTLHAVGPTTQSHYTPHSVPPWRGADVMNGLFKVDISFEGPEHGGVGSTQFSDAVVKESCLEKGLPPDSTPFVQVVMVLKEMLAQRRLNEPFTGGMSSYALLLAVVAVAKERKIIKQEMERIERQRMVVASSANVVAPGNREKTSSQGTGMKEQSPSPAKSVPKREDRGSPSSKKQAPRDQASSNGVGAKPKPSLPRNPKRASEEARLSTAGVNNSKPDVAVRSADDVRPPPPGPSKPKPTVSSWASIASKNPKQVQPRPVVGSVQASAKASAKVQQAPPKISSFAEAVSGKQQASVRQSQSAVVPATAGESGHKRAEPQPNGHKKARRPTSNPHNHKVQASQDASSKVVPQAKEGPVSDKGAPEKHSAANGKSGESTAKPASQAASDETNLTNAPSLFPQGSNDVLEVLCSGEITPGKLLMHFLLFYGEHFDSRASAIDVSGKNHPDYHKRTGPSPYPVLSPYVPRVSGVSIDPVSGMLTVDPIVIFDAIPGREGRNVAKSCYAWSNIRWHFAHCYTTLSSAVERSGTPPTTPAVVKGQTSKGKTGNKSEHSTETADVVSPILELLLSF